MATRPPQALSFLNSLSVIRPYRSSAILLYRLDPAHVHFVGTPAQDRQISRVELEFTFFAGQPPDRRPTGQNARMRVIDHVDVNGNFLEPSLGKVYGSRLSRRRATLVSVR